MRFVRKTLCALLAFLMLLSPLPLSAQAKESTTPYIQHLLQYYRYYQDGAEEEILALLNYITYLDPEQGAMWEAIMSDWAWCNETFADPPATLPDDLPDDDSLCIVVLGFGLNADGSMKPELRQRLKTALEAANSYPNAYIAVTGGATSSRSDATEAGVMAAWLKRQGIDSDRLILDPDAYSTTDNAVNVCGILARSYPSVKCLAIVTSDYHAAWGSVLFQTICDYREAHGKTGLPVVACASNATETSYNTMSYQARGIAAIAGIPYSNLTKPEL